MPRQTRWCALRRDTSRLTSGMPRQMRWCALRRDVSRLYHLAPTSWRQAGTRPAPTTSGDYLAYRLRGLFNYGKWPVAAVGTKRTYIKQVPTAYPFKTWEWRCGKPCSCRGGSCARPKKISNSKIRDENMMISGGHKTRPKNSQIQDERHILFRDENNFGF